MSVNRLLVLVVFLFGEAHAAAFDCKSPNLSEIETIICKDSKLSAQDDNLSSMFSNVLRVSNRQERASLRLEQKQWLDNIRNKCATKMCILNAYMVQISNLQIQFQERWQSRISDVVLAELSSRSRIPQDEMRQLLSDCSGTQLQMNMCSFRGLVEADLDMRQVLARTMDSLPDSCRASLQAKQKQWETSRDRQCKKEVEVAAGGSRSEGIFSSCQGAATEHRTELLRSVKSCSTIR